MCFPCSCFQGFDTSHLLEEGDSSLPLLEEVSACRLEAEAQTAKEATRVDTLFEWRRFDLQQ